MVCSKCDKKSGTSFYCQDHDAALCIDGCFGICHTRKMVEVMRDAYLLSTVCKKQLFQVQVHVEQKVQ